MELVQYQYLEVNLIGIAMLLVIWVHMLGMGRDIRQEGQRGFSRMLWSVVAILASDSLVFLLRGNNTPESMLATHWACMVYFILHTYFGYLWMQYCFKRLYPESHLGKKARMLLLIPCLVSTALWWPRACIGCSARPWWCGSCFCNGASGSGRFTKRCWCSPFPHCWGMYCS